MDETGTYQSVCPRCGRFASHSIYDDNPRHDYWTCNYCPASGDGNPWDEIPKDQRQEAWDDAQAHVDRIRGENSMERIVILVPSVSWSVHIESPDHPTILSGSKGKIIQPRKLDKDAHQMDPYLDICGVGSSLSGEDMRLLSMCVLKVKAKGPLSSFTFKLEV